jgi:DNA-binding CsgD family transcriptional regulator
VERLLMTRFTGLSLEEMRMKFKLHDIRKSKAWQQLREEGKIESKRELIQNWTAKGKTEKQIAELLDISVAEVRKLANGHAK